MFKLFKRLRATRKINDSKKSLHWAFGNVIKMQAISTHGRIKIA